MRRFKGKDVFAGNTYNGTQERFTPRMLLEALDDAAFEVDHKYTTDKIERAQEIIRRYAEEHEIPLGMSRAQREAIRDRKAAARGRELHLAGNDFNKIMKVWDKYQ